MSGRVIAGLDFAINARRRTDSNDRRPTEGWKVHDIVLRHHFDRVPSFAPRCQAADDHEGVEALFSEEIRHTGAGRFA
jgi:hypothetical protein